MKLTENPEHIVWPRSHYVYIEKKGPFQDTAPAAWRELREKTAGIESDAVGFTSLYKIKPEMIYRAGVMMKSKPAHLPEGLKYTEFAGGGYDRFTLTGSYSQLPEACGKVFEIVKNSKIPLREDFYLENYVNDPKTTPEDKLITEILIPTK